MQIGVSNPNVPIFPPRVCTLVLFIIIVVWFVHRYYTIIIVSTVCACLCVTANLGIYAGRRQMMGTNGSTGYGDHF